VSAVQPVDIQIRNPGDRDYADMAEFILRITEDIWERKNIGLIYDCYSKDCPIHTLSGEVTGAEAVVRNTIKTLAGFPDRSMHADGLIIGGDRDSGFYSSHRISSHMTNLSRSDFGPATHVSADVVTIADCVIEDYAIIEEWLARDNLHFVQQLGLDPHAIAKSQARSEPDPASVTWRNEQIDRLRNLPPVEAPEYPENPVAEPRMFVSAVISDLWNHRNLSRASDAYARSCVLNVPPGIEVKGRGKVRRQLTKMVDNLIDTRVSVDHLCASFGQEDTLDLAIRWTVRGTHVDGGFGCKCNGAELLILGISHWRVGKSGIVEDWTVFDQLAILRQIYAQRSHAD